MLALEQWADVAIATLYDSNGKRVIKAGIRGLSDDSATQVIMAINGKKMELEVGNKKQNRTVPEKIITSGYFSHAIMTIGLSATGQNPFRGELYNLGLFNNVDIPDSLGKNLVFINKKIPSEIIGKSKAFFDFTGSNKRKVCDISGNGWYLHVPLIPRIFKYRIYQPINGVYGNRKSLTMDIVINFLGFIPLGAAACLFFLTRSKKTMLSLIYVLIISSLTSFLIETTQIFIPTRESQISDMILNIAGATTGAFAVSFAFGQFIKIFCVEKI
jgi:VanZ family protein